ncbi:MAG TPA: sulfate adenylyltransferase subunit CysD [Candidatus Saccharimonadales bacterium]|nr:sulfate adenylyltransferase subunit CysD [Candidatus Saccharimonadales bacterium]
MAIVVAPTPNRVSCIVRGSVVGMQRREGTAIGYDRGLVRPALSAPNTRAHLGNLDTLEAESVYIMREVAAEFESPVLLFSGGKDSTVLLRLAEKAFRPATFPFPIMHIDTGHNFPEALAFRDARIAELGEQLIVASVEESIRHGRVTEPSGSDPSRNRLQTTTLLDAIADHGFDAIFGGARRDEEKARAKERIFSVRDARGYWNPSRQRAEVWSLYNARIRPGEQMRIFPIANWTELDVWRYVERERLAVPTIYFAHRREVFRRDGMWLSMSPYLPLRDGETPVEKEVRYRTVGDMTCTGAVESSARSVAEVIAETSAARISERGATRADDTFSETAMEDRKVEGYF